jgi:hypothetical protein
VTPGDWNTSNNSAAKTIDIILPSNEFTWSGSYFAAKDFSGTFFSEGYWMRPDVGDREDISVLQVIHRSDTWNAGLGGSAPVMAGPITFSFHDEIDGTLLNLVEFDPITDIPVVREGDVNSLHFLTSCITAQRTEPITIDGQQLLALLASVQVCTSLITGPGGPVSDFSSTGFTYNTSAGDVSYYGERWQKYDDGLGGGSTFSFNGETAFNSGTVAFGKEYSFVLSISGSELTRTASGTIHLSAPEVITASFPYECQDTIDPSYFSHSCSSSNYTQTRIEGTGSGSREP